MGDFKSHSLAVLTAGISRDFSFNMSIDAETPSKRKAGDLKPSPGMVDMYAGGKTAAEVFAKFNDNLRSSVRSNRSLSVPRKDRVSKKTNGQSGGSSGGIGGGGGESFFFGGDDKDRPSMAIICQQVRMPSVEDL